jgi:RNA polymerase sigma-70 factor (ECF subfamily)
MPATLTMDALCPFEPAQKAEARTEEVPTVQRPDTEELVEEFYQPLFRFAYSLAKNEPDAVDLVQQTFLRWAQKGHQLRDPKKVKSWLFTTLHREFLGGRRRVTKFPNVEIDKVEGELPNIEPNIVNKMDSDMVVDALQSVDEKFRAALSLFYFKDHSYKEIADVLEVPIGTVMSRISRGKKQLREQLARLEAGRSATAR